MEFHFVARTEPLSAPRSAWNSQIRRTARGVSPADRAKDRATDFASVTQRDGGRNARNPPIAGVLPVGLAGLEPATSWVRSRRTPALSLVSVQSPVSITRFVVLSG